MVELQPVRGTRDLLGEEQRRHAHVVDTARRVTELYGFQEWQTPILEETRVFSRTLGDTSDVVTKEMYTFADRGGDSMTLRPEGTAGVCRALVSNGLTQSLPQKVFYTGPMFRYERPQKGRYRQFHQIGAELVGPAEPLADAEVIAMGWSILCELGLKNSVNLRLNNLGSFETRRAWRDDLVSYFSAYESELSAESRARLMKNPLRIIDSKDPGDQALAAGAPTIHGHLTSDERKFLSALMRLLDKAGVPYGVDLGIVRGLDYYNLTAFEFVTDKLGAQGTVLAGGRYDGLVAMMGGPNIPGVGWAAGVERLAMLVELPAKTEKIVALIPFGGEPEEELVFQQTQLVRNAGLHAEMISRGSLKRRMERANKLNAGRVVIIGAAERVTETAQVKDLTTGEQTEVALSNLVAYLK